MAAHPPLDRIQEECLHTDSNRTKIVFPNQIIWLASYPKSGNTWMRFLLSNLLCKDPETTEELENAIPDIHCVDDLNAILNREMVIVKSH